MNLKGENLMKSVGSGTAGLKKKILMLIFLILILVFFVMLQFRDPIQAGHMNQIGQVIDQLTEDEVSQQKALDRLSILNGEEVPMLYQFLNDTRPLATKNVRLLSSLPGAFEKYYLTTANNVQQVMIRILCDSTGKCNGGFDKDNQQDVARQYDALAEYCLFKYKKEICPVSAARDKK